MQQKRTLLLQVGKILYPAFYKIRIFSRCRERWKEDWVFMLLTAPFIESPPENQLKIIIKKINNIKGLTCILTHSYEWANTAVLVLLLGWMQTREGPYCAYHQPAIISSTKPSFPTAAKHSLLSKHKTGKGKPVLPMKFKAKSANCFAVSALRCMYCKYYVAILLNKTKVEENFPGMSLASFYSDGMTK